MDYRNPGTVWNPGDESRTYAGTTQYGTNPQWGATNVGGTAQYGGTTQYGSAAQYGGTAFGGTAYGTAQFGVTGQSAMPEQILASDCLISEKFATDCYNMSAYESSNPQLRSAFLQILEDEQSNHRRVFDVMQRKGWYPASPADSREVNSTQSRVQQLVSSVQPTFR